MNLTPREETREIAFYFDLGDERVLEHIQFVLLVALRFAGRIDEDSIRRASIDGYEWGSLTMALDDKATYLDARNWCREKIDEDGQIISSYLAALSGDGPEAATAQHYLDAIRVHSSEPAPGS